MNEDILLLSNECVYDKNMKCANIDISNQKLKINFSYLEQICSLDWLKHALNPDHSVVFLDYSKYCLSNNISLDQIKDSNQIEADFIGKLVHYLQKLRYDYNNLSIITPYKNQETLIKKNLSHIRQIDNNIITIDKSQGIEKEMIIISFVKTNKKTKILKDIQRINVAFTRSKSKLIIIGLVEYLECVENLRKYIEIIRNKKWIYEIK
jgi:DNA replication ATP-dependent helicase Dna2